MEGFGIDKIQAEFIADIRLRNINKEYILKRTQETEALENEIKKLEEIVKSKAKIRNIIIKELEQIIKKYPSERRTRIITADNVQQFDEEDHIEDYPVLLFLTREGYFKKITKKRRGFPLRFSLHRFPGGHEPRPAGVALTLHGRNEAARSMVCVQSGCRGGLTC